MRVDLPLDKMLWKIRIGPPGLRASGPPGRSGPLGRRGPRAGGPSGRRVVAGLFLAKPDGDTTVIAANRPSLSRYNPV